MVRLIQLMLPLVLLAPGHAAAPGADDAALCDRAAGADAIAACSRLIATDAVQGNALARLYRNRCAAHAAARDPDRALGDCNEAVRLNPGQPPAMSSAAMSSE
jgi:hypothetical protein